MKLDQRGAMDPLAVPLIFTVFIALALGGFAIWSFASYTDVNNNLDAKIEEAVTAEKGRLEEELQAEFEEKEKLPLVKYTAPAAQSSISVSYPKTWSASVNEISSGKTELDGIFHPDFIRGDKADVPSALRLTLEDSQFSSVLKSFEGEIEDGVVRSSPVNAAGVSGVRLDGQIDKDVNGSMVIFPIRDKTVKLWTESSEFLGDFNNNILPSFTFIP